MLKKKKKQSLQKTADHKEEKARFFKVCNQYAAPF